MRELIVSVAGVIDRPGESRDVRVSGRLRDVAVALAGLAQAPVECTGIVESVVEGVLVTGRVKATSECECARCLKPFRMPLEVEVRELFAGRSTDSDPDAYVVEDRSIDLEPMLRDALALALPLNPVCRPECKGLCSGCGRDLAIGSCSCSETKTDPRWAPLEALRAKLEA